MVDTSKIELKQGKGTPNHGGGKGGYYWHIYYGDERAGRVYINLHSPDDSKPYASITIELNKTHLGMGIGRICFAQACELSEYNEVYAEMRKNNIAAQKAAEYAGFKIVGKTKSSQIKMVWKRKVN